MDKKNLITLLQKQKLLPLYYHESAAVSAGVLQALYDGGIRMVEYTNRGNQALQNFGYLKSMAQKLPGLRLGIGTIKGETAAKTFIDAGADFVVCPTVNAAVAAAVQAAGLLWIPGCMTPTEIALAETCGAGIVKIFPGSLLGPGYIQAVKALFPSLLFMPTGGVTIEVDNLTGWFKAGVAAVGIGSDLIAKQWMQEQNYAAIKEQTGQALQRVQTIGATG